MKEPTTMLFHIDVTPHADEAERVTPDQIDAGQAWLESKPEIERALPRLVTGGYMDVRMPAHDLDEALTQLHAWLADYPLLDTVELIIEPMFDTLGEGFDVLRGANARGERTPHDPHTVWAAAR
jgi:hypothetical protein